MRLHPTKQTLFLCAVFATALFLQACGNNAAGPVADSSSGGGSGPGGGTDSPAVDNTPPAEKASIDDQVLPDMTAADRCDFINREYCLFPWPNNHFTVADAATDTGIRVNLNVLSMPSNINGKPIEPEEWNRNDGFSPGQAVLARVPGLDLVQTGAAPLTDIAASLAADAPIAIYDLGPAQSADTTDVPVPHLVWAELDANLTQQPAASPTVDPGPALIIRPAKNFLYGHRYVVVLRNLKDQSDALLQPPAAFRIYRDNHASALPMVNARRAHFEELFQRLGLAGVKRSELYLTWDFTVASQRNMTERVLHIRDDALTAMGTLAPVFTVDAVINNPPNGDVSDVTARRIRGHVSVPCYLNTPNCISGGVFNYSPDPSDARYGDGLPDQVAAGTLAASISRVPFTCSIARKTVNGAADPALATSGTPARPSLYGHGLLGSRDEGNTYDLNVRRMAEEHNILFCMMDWAGMASGNTPDDSGDDPQKYDPLWDQALQDAPTIVSILQDMGQFPKLADRVQQGLLNFIFLGKAMLHADGFCSHAAFRAGSTCLIDRTELYYDGNSQGGIIGGALAAVSPDIRSAVLGVIGMNYSTLLQRSVDFDTYAQVFYNAYPAGMDQQFILSLIQMLWDRAENNGYAQTLKPGANLPGTPAKRILLHPAFGDHQVTMTSAEVMARTIEATVHCPAVVAGPRTQRGPAVQAGVHPDIQAEMDYLASNGAQLRTPHPMSRHPDDEPYFGLACATPGQAGNALVVWDRGPRIAERDKGVVPPPTDNTPPRPELGYGGDPHSDPRNEVPARLQKSEWFKGRFVDVCNGKPCSARGFNPDP